MYYDAHTHLNDDTLYSTWQAYVQKFCDSGGKGLIVVGIDEERNRRAIQISKYAQKQFPSVYIQASIGYHPACVCFGKISTTKSIRDVLQTLRTLYIQNQDMVVAIGECGIDMHYTGDYSLAIQKDLFAQQCDLAVELQLPIVIHSRAHFYATFDVLKKYKHHPVYFHCRGYGPEEIDIVQNYFTQVRIGFCGNCTYPTAHALRASLQAVHLSSLLLETDAPYLAPQEYRGGINQPAYISRIYTYVSQFLNRDVYTLMQTIENNLFYLFPKK